MTLSDNRQRLRVLHVVQALDYGGAEKVVSEMLRQSDHERFDNHVLILSEAGRYGEDLEPYATLTFARPMSRLSMLRPASLARDIASIAPDVVHTHSGLWFKAARAARLARVPWLVHTEHGRAVPDPWLSRALDRSASRRTDVVVGVSDAVAKVLRENVVAHPERVRVIPNGVDVGSFRPMADDGALRRELAVPRDRAIIGSVGRIEPVKGYEVMIEAYIELRRTWTDGTAPVLVIAGDGSERARLTALASEAGVGGDVHWLGWRDDIHRLHSAFTLFTMSSHSEGTSVSLLEAMSAGLAPIVTAVGGNAAVLGTSLAHRLVPPSNPGALAAAWRDGLEDREKLQHDAEAARARVLDGFTLEGMVRAYERLYRREGVRGTTASV
jgi:glycosyltransferase involved in cell wall biosynthesis